MEDRLQIIGLGMCTLDVLIRCKELPTWERGGRVNAFGFDGGGPVGTAMVAAAKLGARVGFIGTAGTDAPAEFKLRSMRECGIDLSHMVYRNSPEDRLWWSASTPRPATRLFGVATLGEGQVRPEELDPVTLPRRITCTWMDFTTRRRSRLRNGCAPRVRRWCWMATKPMAPSVIICAG